MEERDEERQSRTLWFGDLDGFENEAYFNFLLTPHTPLRIRIVRDGTGGICAFVEFASSELAAQVRAACDGRPRPLSRRVLRVNWAARAGGGRTRREEAALHKAS